MGGGGCVARRQTKEGSGVLRHFHGRVATMLYPRTAEDRMRYNAST